MSVTTAALPFSEASSGARYVASVASSWSSVRDGWTRMADEGAALTFQGREWLEPLLETLSRRRDLDVLPVTAQDGEGQPVAALPLVRERGFISRIGFVDGGLADYNAPILSRRAPQDAASAVRLWRAVRRVLPASDIVRFERMPSRIGGLLNPFVLLPGVQLSPADGLTLAMPDGFDAWQRNLPRRYRMELGRCARLFDALPTASFQRLDADNAAFETLERLQRERIASLGLPYGLDHPDATSFYRALSKRDDGSSVLTALFVEGDVVAALFGMRRHSTFTMLRIGASSDLSRMSPARGLIARTMELLAKDGVTTFDFGLGDYPYKRKLGGTPHGLVDFVSARSLFGLAEAAEWRLRAHVRRTPQLRAAALRLRSIVRRSDGDVAVGTS